MIQKILLFGLSLGLMSLGLIPLRLTAQTSPSVIVDQRDSSSEVAIKVESGKSTITGSMKRNLSSAFQSWRQNCARWKAEMRRLNDDNLLISDCGKPAKKKETGSYVRYESQAEYKIKIVAP